MKQIQIVALSISLVMLLAATAYAGTFIGTNHHDVLFGTKHADTLKGLGGTDDINGRGGDDVIYGGPGEDFLRGNKGDDVIHAGDDKQTDEVRCGGGTDVAYVSGADHSANNLTGCETVKTEH